MLFQWRADVRIRKSLFYIMTGSVCSFSLGDIPPGWTCQYTLGSPIVFKVPNACKDGCTIRPAEKEVSSGGMKCVHKEFEDVYAMTACRTRKNGVLSAQDCGNASAKNGARDPIGIQTPRELKIKVEPHTEAPPPKDDVPANIVGWDCDYTAGSPNVITVDHSCESNECNTKPSYKQLVTGSALCSKPGYSSFYTVIVCNYEEGKIIPSANQCRIRFHKENKDSALKKITLRSGLPILTTGNNGGQLSDGTEALNHVIKRE